MRIKVPSNITAKQVAKFLTYPDIHAWHNACPQLSVLKYDWAKCWVAHRHSNRQTRFLNWLHEQICNYKRKQKVNLQPLNVSRRYKQRIFDYILEFEMAAV
jgi:hypothetical protein